MNVATAMASPVKHRSLALAETLTKAATWVLTHPDVPVVNMGQTIADHPRLGVVCSTEDGLEATTRAIPGPWSVLRSDPAWWSEPRIVRYTATVDDITFEITTYDWMRVPRGEL